MKFLSVLLLILFCSAAQAQVFTISGKVTNAENGQPLQGASVYPINTTMGTVTDAEGHYKLMLPAGGYDLIVSFSGRQSESQRISSSNNNDVLNFSLKEKQKELESVAVVASNEVANGYEVYGKFFLDNFIGSTANAAATTLQNPEALKFYFSKKRNRLKILATEPLRIENKALGYNMRYELDSFFYEYNSKTTLYAGSMMFTEMQPADSAQLAGWKANRAAAYKGSVLHFMRSYYRKDLKGEGFDLNYYVKENGKDRPVKIHDAYKILQYTKDDSTQVATLIPNNEDLGVWYLQERPDADYLKANPGEPAKAQFTLLTLVPDGIHIEQNGYFYDQEDMTIFGYWNWTKIADMLPYDYAN